MPMFTQFYLSQNYREGKKAMLAHNFKAVRFNFNIQKVGKLIFFPQKSLFIPKKKEKKHVCL